MLKNMINHIFIYILLIICIGCESNIVGITESCSDCVLEVSIPELNIDDNGYYHLTIDPIENQQTIHRFGAHITNVDIWGRPTQVIWNCVNYWEYDLFNIPMNVPIINGTSYADPLLDSVYCVMAPVGSMIGDTIEIKGTAYFEEGDISLQDSFHIIFE